ncbi:CPBP family intramembrane glutamic endopeptidase [Leifsonia sp. AG29]|uniref:CPBP family intramembrane glutamic endopeptidase n=1 Tax=Leifsonia sp. AG29 TaxID=2598860 RepID=UPI00131B6329|nr:CPBP family intramembrane glutamic endopeptidase [Leifsonia sp. AG29]
MKRHPLVVFFVAAFAFPWLLWGTTLALQVGLIGWHIPESLGFWIGLPLATYGTAALTGGWPAVKDLLLRLIRVKVRPLWYLVAIGLPVGIAAAAVGLGTLSPTPAAVGALIPASAILGALLLNCWEWLITEETAWRGYALPRLQRRFDPLTASLVLGALWALWHLPLFFIADSFQARIPFLGFALSTVATSVLIGWLFNHARGSVLLAALFHGFTDVSIAFSGVLTSGAALFWITVGIQVLLAAAVSVDLHRRDRRSPELPATTI